MMKRKRDRHMDGLLLLILFSIFTMCALWVLMNGAGIYQRLAQRDSGTYAARTAAQYIATKVRQAGCAEQVSVGSLEGHNSLILTEEIDNLCYETYIYCHGGYLRELFTQTGAEFRAEDGEKILAAQEMTVCTESTTGELLCVRIQTADSSWREILLCPRGGEGAEP